MKMYRTRHKDKIEEFEVTKTTNKSVWYVDGNGNSGRENRVTLFRTWHESWAGAKTYLLEKEMQTIKILERQLNEARNNLSKIEELKNEIRK